MEKNKFEKCAKLLKKLMPWEVGISNKRNVKYIYVIAMRKDIPNPFDFGNLHKFYARANHPGLRPPLLKTGGDNFYFF
jgi:hypothetical protein